MERLFGEIRARVFEIRGRQDQISIQKAKANLEYAVRWSLTQSSIIITIYLKD